MFTHEFNWTTTKKKVVFWAGNLDPGRGQAALMKKGSSDLCRKFVGIFCWDFFAGLGAGLLSSQFV